MRALDNGVAGTAVADLSASPAACGVAGPRGWHVVVQGHEEELNAPLDNDSLDVESASSTRVAGDGAPLQRPPQSGEGAAAVSTARVGIQGVDDQGCAPAVAPQDVDLADALSATTAMLADMVRVATTALRVGDAPWPAPHAVCTRGAPALARGRHPTRHVWQRGVGSGAADASIANITRLNEHVAVCKRTGCHALVAVNALVKAARRARRPRAAIAAGDACISRPCCRIRGCRFEVSKHVTRQAERTEAVLSGARTLVSRPATADQATVSTLSAADAADALEAAMSCALAELPHARVLVARIRRE